MKLLDNFRNLRVWEARCHGNEPYPCTCWYVSFSDIRNEEICIILHFDISPSNIYIYFRFLGYAPQDVLNKGAWGIRGTWKYLRYNDYIESEEELAKVLENYLKNIRFDFDNDRLNCKKWRVRLYPRGKWMKLIKP